LVDSKWTCFGDVFRVRTEFKVGYQHNFPGGKGKLEADYLEPIQNGILENFFTK